MKKLRNYERFDKRCYVYDGTDIIGKTRISYNLDFFNGHTNCNPTNGKHKSISMLDNKYVIIWTDSRLQKNIGKTVDDEFALIEILKAKKAYFLEHEKYKRLKLLYLKNDKKYDAITEQYWEENRINATKEDETILVINDNNFLTEVYSSMPHPKIRIINENEVPYYVGYTKIWKAGNKLC